MRSTTMRGAMMMLAAGAVVAFSLPAHRSAHARSGKLWAERSSGSGPLAQVPNFRALAEKLIPAVVSIQVEQRVKVSSGRSPRGRRGGSGNDPFDFFHRYFGGEVPREYHNRGLGTGFVISKDGLILTNNHVVDGADNIEVTFAKGDGGSHTMTAKILGSAPEYDVALLRTTEPAGAAVAYLGDSDRTEIGDWVMAVGNPFGLSHSVSVGIISAKERREIAPSGRRGLYDFLQTDASINPGNSGGPLVNMRGEVIGINTAINAAGSGIGFAIPINMVKAMLPELESKGKFSRSWIGIRIQPLTDELAESYGLRSSRGALVAEVVPNSPASKAELREGDVILSFDGKDVRTSTDLPLYASMAGIGHRVPLVLWRDGKSHEVNVTLQAFPDQGAVAGAGEHSPSGELGMTVADMTPELQRAFGIRQSHGVVIKDVERGSASDRAGLRPGDRVLTLNGKSVKSARDFAKRVKGTQSGELLRMKVSRQGSRVFLAMRKP